MTENLESQTSATEAAKPKARKTLSKKPAKSKALAKVSSRQAARNAKDERLATLAKEIRSSQESIDVLSKTAREKMLDTMVEVAKCGKLLSECKTLVARGDWLNWLNDNCKMSISTAQRYMRVATHALSNKARALYLEEPKSIRQTIALLSGGKKKTAAKTDDSATGEKNGEEVVVRIKAQAKKLIAALNTLPREKRNEVRDALEEIRKWINDGVIDV